ncbi:MAG: hypothetical protein KA116_11555 [Proteobacteria bacterium]|nr:hypothetical protein [Pseudomonadota bacterium]
MKSTNTPIRYFGWVCSLVLLASCVSSQQPPRPLDFPYARIYLGSFNDVWSATVRILDLYSITVANREAGLLQTEWVETRFNSELFKYPDNEPRLEEVSYRLKIKLSKAFISQTGQAAVRVQVLKELKEYKNFFSDWERVATDGYEEKIILYRIGQRLAILNAQREAKTKKKKENKASPAAAPVPEKDAETPRAN